MNIDIEQFTLQIKNQLCIFDPAGFGLQNSVEVSVFVDDVNDNAPVVNFPSTHNASVQVKSSAKEGAFVTQIIAHDPDMGKTLHCYITSSYLTWNLVNSVVECQP